jgi:hypothetical protein
MREQHENKDEANINDKRSRLPLEHVEGGGFEPRPDRRARMEEPPPVRLVAVEDVRVEAPAGLEKQLDEFYGGILKFEREYADGDVIVYGAENFRLLIKVVEPPVLRDDMRPILIEVPNLLAVEHQLVDLKIEYQRLRRLTLAHASLFLMDPARNWVELIEYRAMLG